jgi:hypothetical protein
MEQGDILKSHCNSCGNETKHHLVFLHRTHWKEEFSRDVGDFVDGEDVYELLQCAGCDAVTIRHSRYFSENRDDAGRSIPVIHFYPPHQFRCPPKWMYGMSLVDDKQITIVEIPSFVTRLMKEIYVALYNNCLSLAAMGVRALLEKLMIEQVGDLQSFGKNLREFQNRGFVSTQQKSFLESTLEVGHASIHRDYVPIWDDLTVALDITETVLALVYVHGPQADALKRRVPPRQ